MIYQLVLVIKFAFIFNLKAGAELFPVYAIWMLIVSGSSLCTVFFIDFIILSALFPLYGKSRKCFLIFDTSLCDVLFGNCCWCCSCS